MQPAESLVPQRLLLDGQEVECQFVRSKTAKKLRIKVKPGGVDVVVPEGRDRQEALTFVSENQTWVIQQLERTRRLRSLRRPDRTSHGLMPFRGNVVPVRVVRSDVWRAPNKVVLEEGSISIVCGMNTGGAPERSLENWLRKQARERVSSLIEDSVFRMKRVPNRVYIMDQRTKWGNCSALGNLSFNWRLIMAPDFVLHYIVTHEMVHLAIPDHSHRFWLMVQSICPNSDRARQWLIANGNRLIGMDCCSVIFPTDVKDFGEKNE